MSGEQSAQQETAPSPLVRIGGWQMLALIAACVAVAIYCYPTAPPLAYVLIALAAAAMLFGVLGATGSIDSKFGKFGGSAALFVGVLLVLFEFAPLKPAESETELALYLQPELTTAPNPLGDKFVGRQREFIELDAAWQSVFERERPQPTVGIIAWGGFGKSALVRQWLHLKDQPLEKLTDRFCVALRDSARFDLPCDAWPGQLKPQALLWHTFAQDEGDAFAQRLLDYFNGGKPVPIAGLTSAHQQLAALRKAMAGRRYLIVLDGLEVLQNSTRGDQLGELGQSLPELLLKEHSAGRLGRGLLLVTSRLPLRDLRDQPGYTPIALGERPLSDEEVSALLGWEGVDKNTLDARTLAGIIEATGRHPLALKTLANLLGKHRQGDARRWVEMNEVFEVPAGRAEEQHLWRVLSWTERLLSADEKRVMTALAFFRESVAAEWLAPLLTVSADESESAQRHRSFGEMQFDWHQLHEQQRNGAVDVETFERRTRELNEERQAAPTDRIPEFTPAELALPGQSLVPEQLRRALESLVDFKLLKRDKASGRYDSHGLIREYFRRRVALSTDGPQPEQIHLRLYRLYAGVIQPQYRPDGADGLAPLYAAVHHGVLGGQVRAARKDVYVERILRGAGNGGFYSTKKLGLFATDLAALGGFFAPGEAGPDWHQPSQQLSVADRAWLLSVAAFRLRALGRLDEARQPMAAGLEMRVEQKVWKSAAIIASNLSELSLTLDDIAAAVARGAESVAHADRSEDAFWRMCTRTAHADALHQSGERSAARALFTEAEAMQAAHQPSYPRLYSLQGFQYADLLLASAERAAWRATLAGLASARPETPGQRAAVCGDCDAVEERAEEAQKIALQNNWLLDIALNNLTLARSALYRTLLTTPKHSDAASGASMLPTTALAEASRRAEAAVEGLRKAGQADELPKGLLTRAWLHRLLGDETASRADLREARQIAEAGPMPLHLADIALTEARLFNDRDKLAEARELIEKHGYHRRDEELADAEQALAAQ